MTRPPSTADAAVVDATAAVSGRLDQRLSEATRAIQDLVSRESPDLAGDAPLAQLLHEVVLANVETCFAAIRHNIPVAEVKAPTIALEHARRLAQRDVAVNELVRGYRVAHAVALNLVLDEIRAARLDPELALRVVEQMSMISFGYIDQMSQHVVTAYQEERERWLENRNARRAALVRDLLDGGDIAGQDIDAMTLAIRYPLQRCHLAAVVWSATPGEADRSAALHRFLGDLAEMSPLRAEPLVIAVDDATVWVWLPVPQSDAAEVMGRVRAHAEAAGEHIWMAIGAPLPGLDGFRRSHQQALAAHRVATGSAAPQRVSAADDDGLSAAALLGVDLDAARAWVNEVLGPLACATEGDERLRGTLRVFLGTGSSFKAAGEKLHYHVNTMKYRVRRAVERRGRPIDEDRLDVEIALLLCHWYGPSVLRPPD